MAIQERLDHANHNESVCDLLLQSGKFDWVVTTAFYSSLHFVQHKIFPLKQKTADGQKFDVPNFNVFSKGFNPLQKSKHELLIELVEKHCSDIAPEYNWLYDACRNSRYHQYHIKEGTAKKAKDSLNKIKAYCTM